MRGTLDAAEDIDILIISFTDLRTDARVRRQVEALRDMYKVATLATAPSGLENAGHFTMELQPFHMRITFVPLRKIFSAVIHLRRSLLNTVLGWYDMEYWRPWRKRLLSQHGHLKPKLIIANDLDALPLALRLAKGRAKVLYDAHEYAPRQHDDDPLWVKEFQRSNEYICKRYMPLADACTTVAMNIAVAYEELTGVRPHVIDNAPAYEALAPTPTVGSIIKIVHHGIFNAKRRTKELVLLMDQLRAGHELHLFGPPPTDPSYAREIRSMIAERPNVYQHSAIAPEHIATTINQFDIGIHHLSGGSFNHRNALPNKFFDFIQARLAIIVGPNPEMASLVRAHDLGVVARDHSMEAFLEAIQQLTPERIMRHKRNSDACANIRNADHNAHTLRTIVARLIG